MDREKAALVEQAKAILALNWTGEYTQPGPRLYPHQWSWDSALIAIAYAHYDRERAEKELRHLFEAQWTNGLLPQIVFNPRFRDYFPGPSFWNADESPHAPKHKETSGVVLPPVHATAVLAIYKAAGDEAKEFLGYAFRKLKAWHEYLYRDRDPRGEGLVYIRHPWESGMDNSPTWDQIMQRMHLRAGQIPEYKRADTNTVSTQDRPTSASYDRFAYLVKFFADRDYDEDRIRKDCPFLVQDVLFNSLLCRSGHDMAQIAHVLGEDPAPFEEQAQKTARAIEDKLWSEEHGVYFDYDLVAERPIHVYFAPNFLPLFAGTPDEARAKRLVDALENDGFGLSDKNVTPVPSLDMHGFGFSPVEYWRGPVWLNINWFLMHGLKDYGYHEYADRLRAGIVELCREAGFHEYFNPTTGQGHGSDLFSWSAALLIDVLMNEKD
ncbi:MAG: glycoside hydrolase [Rubrobacter sp.]|nr:glycoside hydrolase [Rubrobacter sp.]